MNRQIKRNFSLASSLLFCMLFISACGNAMGNNATTGSAAIVQTPKQVLQNSQNSMKALKSAHIDMTDTTTTKMNMSTTGSIESKVVTSGSGTEKAPGQMQLDMAANMSSQGLSSIDKNMKMSEIVTGGKFYIKTQNQWYTLDSSSLKGSSGADSQLQSDSVSSVNSLLKLSNQGQMKDEGYQTIDGSKLRHISVIFNKNLFQDLVDATNKSSITPSLGSNAIIQQFTKGMKDFKGSVDIWTDEATGYTHRAEMKMSFTLDTSSMQPQGYSAGSNQNEPLKMTMNMDMVINLGKFNEPVTITAPANAKSTSNLLDIFK